MRTVTILLTRYSDLFEKFVNAFEGNQYAHASI